MVTPLVLGIAAGVAVLVLSALAYRWLERARDRRYGRLLAVDGEAADHLVSYRYRLAGRPDEIRQLPDGRSIPIEWTRRAAPRRGPPLSHRIQVEAYCLLLEESTGRSPPFGVLRYSDGSEFRIPWDVRARAELLAVRAEVAQPYDGRATPSAARCRACPWVEVCDARVLA